MIHYATPRAHMLAMADELFGHVLAGTITRRAEAEFALADAADAHRALESRQHHRRHRARALKARHATMHLHATTRAGATTATCSAAARPGSPSR